MMIAIEEFLGEFCTIHITIAKELIFLFELYERLSLKSKF